MMDLSKLPDLGVGLARGLFMWLIMVFDTALAYRSSTCDLAHHLQLPISLVFMQGRNSFPCPVLHANASSCSNHSLCFGSLMKRLMV